MVLTFFIQILRFDVPVGLAKQAGDSYPIAPQFSGTDLQGRSYSLDKYRRKDLVIYFWATWCPACRNEVRDVKKAYRLLRSEGVSFISVSLDKHRDTLQKFIKENQITYPVLFDGQGWNNQIAKAYSIAATPTVVVVDRLGKIQSTGHWISEFAAVGFKKFRK